MTKETKGDLAHFLIELAQEADKRTAFHKDPESVMDEAGLTEPQKKLIREAFSYLAFARPGFGSLPGILNDGDGGGREIVVVIVVVIVIL